MAFSTSSRFSNAVQTPLAKFNLRESSTTPSYPVGYKVELADGRVFRYAQFGASTSAGHLVSADVSETGLAVTDNSVIAPASAVAVAGETLKPGALGSRYVELTVAAISANQFAGAYLQTEDDTGEAYVYRIKGNTATDNPATGNIRIELYDALEVALDTTTDVAIISSPWNNVEGATSTDDCISGVSLAVQAANDYGWVQTWGPASVLIDGSIGQGDVVALSDGVTGAVHLLGGGGTTIADINTEPLVGYSMQVGTSGAQGTIFLQIHP